MAHSDNSPNVTAKKTWVAPTLTSVDKTSNDIHFGLAAVSDGSGGTYAFATS